jgi:hypothetical protein
VTNEVSKHILGKSILFLLLEFLKNGHRDHHMALLKMEYLALVQLSIQKSNLKKGYLKPLEISQTVFGTQSF